MGYRDGWLMVAKSVLKMDEGAYRLAIKPLSYIIQSMHFNVI